MILFVSHRLGLRFCSPYQAILLVVFFLCASPLFAQVASPPVPNVIEAYQRAVENQDPVAVYSLLSPAFRQEETLDEFRIRFERDYPLILEESRRLTSMAGSSLRAEVPLGTAVAHLVWTPQGWRISNPSGILQAGQEENMRQALSILLLPEDLEQAVESCLAGEMGGLFSERYWILQRVAFSMKEREAKSGTLKTIPLENSRNLVLIRVKDGWRLHDIKWLIDP